jgi:hypothetical protein
VGAAAGRVAREVRLVCPGTLSSGPPPRFVAYVGSALSSRAALAWVSPPSRRPVQKHVASVAGELMDAFEEVETGKLNSRPALAQALAACRAMHATLIIAKLAPRSCCPWWREAGRGCGVFCDLPQVPPGPSGKFVIAIMARSRSWKRG